MPRGLRVGVTDVGSWAARSTASGVIRAFGFDSAADLGPTDEYGPYGYKAGTSPPHNAPVLDTSVHLPSGASSLRFTIPGLSGSDASGYWFTNFRDDGSLKFGGGDTFYVQWRQRFNSAYLSTMIYRTYLTTTTASGVSAGASVVPVASSAGWASGYGIEMPLVGGGSYLGRLTETPLDNNLSVTPALTGNVASGAAVTGGLIQAGLKQADIMGGDTLVLNAGNYTSNEAYGGVNIGSSDISKIVIQSYDQRHFSKMYRYAVPGFGDTDLITVVAGPDWLYHNQLTPPGNLNSVSFSNPLDTGNMRPWVANEWLTFQVKVTLGTETTDPAQSNHPVYGAGTELKLWMAREGGTQELLQVWTPFVDASDYGKNILRGTVAGEEANYGPNSQPLGKFVLMPYMTTKDVTQPHVDLVTWYDEVIISTNFILDPVD